ncbi:MAG: hypothetical protein OXG37_04575 [Actinomycetia bacterium]|nr:hypothetical protein [Actinomycetes bacterium]
MRARPLFLVLVAAAAVALTASGCRGEPGPPGPPGQAGPPGPAGADATLDEAAIEAIVERVLARQENSIAEARRLDSERLDNLIHSIIDAITEIRLAQQTASEADSELPASSASLPGDPYEFGPAAGDTLAVVGVAWNGTLDILDVPGGEIVARLDPWGEVVATGNTRKVSTAVWHEVRAGELTGWAGADFLAPLGWSRDMASQVVEKVGETPIAETLLDLGLIVAGVFVSEGEVPPRVVFSDRPAHAEALSQITVDVLGLPDDSVRGHRIVVSADAVHEQGFGTGPFTIWSVHVTDICDSSRGVSEEGLCA